MLDYVNNIDLFKTSSEEVLANLIYELVTCYGDIDRGELLSLFGFIELVDNIEEFSSIDREEVIGYLIDRYPIYESTNNPFFDVNLGSISPSITPIGGAVYWENVLGKPIPVSDIDNFETNVLNIVQNYMSGFNISAALEEDVRVKGTSSANINDGDLLEQGLTFTEYVKRKYTKELFYMYTQPNASIILANVDTQVEAGSNINPYIYFYFTKQDSGGLVSLNLLRNEINVYTAANTNAYNESYQIGEETITYNSNMSYLEGPIKLSNLGNPSPGNILAGSKVTNNVAIQGLRKVFYGTDRPVTNSDQVRNLQYSLLGVANGTTFDIFIPMGSTSVSFSYIGTLSPVSSVKYIEGLSAEVKDIFTLTTVNVTGANGYGITPHKTYNFNFPNPTEKDSTYRVTI
jgi:hypothetical protein